MKRMKVLAVVALGCCAWISEMNSVAAQTFNDVEYVVERAISLGKSGQTDAALSALAPFLTSPTQREAKACYVAGFLHKERFKSEAGLSSGRRQADRSEAVRLLQLSKELGTTSARDQSWQTSASQALQYLGGTYFDDAIQAVRTFEPGDEQLIFELFDAHVSVAKSLDPTLDATRERTEFHKNIARAYRQWYEATSDPSHFEGLITQYQRALELTPDDITATYNLAVNIYNRGVTLIKSMDETTTLGEIFEIQDASAEMFRDALPWFERANVLQPRRPETLRGLMIVHHALFDDAEAERYRGELEMALNP